MSLTKKDKEEIKQMVIEVIKSQDIMVDEKTSDILTTIDYWNENAIDTGMGFVVAPFDLVLPDDKKYFTWDEAMEIEEKYLKPNGWRLPTVKDFTMLYGKYGLDEDGEENVKNLVKIFSLGLNGFRDYDDDMHYQGTGGLYWSSTACSSDTYAHYLYLNSSGAVDPADIGNKYDGFSLRCVKDKEEEWLEK